MKLKVKYSNNIYISVDSEINLLTISDRIKVSNSNFQTIVYLSNYSIKFQTGNPNKNKTVIEISGFHYDFNRWNNISFICE